MQEFLLLGSNGTRDQEQEDGQQRKMQQQDKKFQNTTSQPKIDKQKYNQSNFNNKVQKAFFKNKTNARVLARGRQLLKQSYQGQLDHLANSPKLSTKIQEIEILKQKMFEKTGNIIPTVQYQKKVTQLKNQFNHNLKEKEIKRLTRKFSLCLNTQKYKAKNPTQQKIIEGNGLIKNCVSRSNRLQTSSEYSRAAQAKRKFQKRLNTTEPLQRASKNQQQNKNLKKKVKKVHKFKNPFNQTMQNFVENNQPPIFSSRLQTKKIKNDFQEIKMQSTNSTTDNYYQQQNKTADHFFQQNISQRRKKKNVIKNEEIKQKQIQKAERKIKTEDRQYILKSIDQEKQKLQKLIHHKVQTQQVIQVHGLQGQPSSFQTKFTKFKKAYEKNRQQQNRNYYSCKFKYADPEQDTKRYQQSLINLEKQREIQLAQHIHQNGVEFMTKKRRKSKKIHNNYIQKEVISNRRSQLFRKKSPKRGTKMIKVKPVKSKIITIGNPNPQSFHPQKLQTVKQYQNQIAQVQQIMKNYMSFEQAFSLKDFEYLVETKQILNPPKPRTQSNRQANNRTSTCIHLQTATQESFNKPQTSQEKLIQKNYRFCKVKLKRRAKTQSKKIRKTAEEEKKYFEKHSRISKFVLENPIEFVKQNKNKWIPYSRRRLDQIARKKRYFTTTTSFQNKVKVGGKENSRNVSEMSIRQTNLSETKPKTACATNNNVNKKSGIKGSELVKGKKEEVEDHPVWLLESIYKGRPKTAFFLYPKVCDKEKRTNTRITQVMSSEIPQLLFCLPSYNVYICVRQVFEKSG